MEIDPIDAEERVQGRSPARHPGSRPAALARRHRRDLHRPRPAEGVRVVGRRRHRRLQDRPRGCRLPARRHPDLRRRGAPRSRSVCCWCSACSPRWPPRARWPTWSTACSRCSRPAAGGLSGDLRPGRRRVPAVLITAVVAIVPPGVTASTPDAAVTPAVHRFLRGVAFGIGGGDRRLVFPAQQQPAARIASGRAPGVGWGPARHWPAVSSGSVANVTAGSKLAALGQRSRARAHGLGKPQALMSSTAASGFG